MKLTKFYGLQCLGILLALTFIGCSATSHVITGQPRDPIQPQNVTLYTKAPLDYEEIGIVEASSRNSFSFGDQAKMDTVIERLKEAAASLGANGVQNTSSERGPAGVGTGVGVSSGGGTYVSTGIFTSTSSKTGRGLAIYVLAE